MPCVPCACRLVVPVGALILPFCRTRPVLAWRTALLSPHYPLDNGHVRLSHHLEGRMMNIQPEVINSIKAELDLLDSHQKTETAPAEQQKRAFHVRNLRVLSASPCSAELLLILKYRKQEIKKRQLTIDDRLNVTHKQKVCISVLPSSCHRH